LGFLKMIEFNLKSRAALECARRYITYLLGYINILAQIKIVSCKFRKFFILHISKIHTLGMKMTCSGEKSF